MTHAAVENKDVISGQGHSHVVLSCAAYWNSVYLELSFHVTALPFLQGTVALLYPPVLLIMIGYIVSLTVGWNISHAVMFFYEYRVL